MESDESRGCQTVVAEAIDAASEADEAGEVYLVNPSADLVVGAVRYLDQTSGVSIRLVAAKRRLDAALDGFYYRSLAVDVAAADRVEIRAGDVPSSTAAVSEAGVTPIVSIDGTTALGRLDDPSAAAELVEAAAAVWRDASEYPIREPALSVARDGLADQFGEAVREDFDAALDQRHGMDGTVLVLLVAAANGLQLYRVSNWGEDIGIGSRATFSRRKTALEDNDVLETGRIEMDVGRPRHRLQLTDEYADLAVPTVVQRVGPDDWSD
jgi:hypothetical protein